MSSRHAPAYRFLIGALAASSLLTSALATLTLHVETPLSQPAAAAAVHAAQPSRDNQATVAAAANEQAIRE